MKYPNESLAVLNRPTGLAASRANTQILRSAGQATTHEQCRALLAYSALENTAMLSALEAQCYRIAPFGEHRYRKIVDAYAAGGISKILRW